MKKGATTRLTRPIDGALKKCFLYCIYYAKHNVIHALIFPIRKYKACRVETPINVALIIH